MQELRNEIGMLIGKLETGIFAEDRVAAEVLMKLKSLLQEEDVSVRAHFPHAGRRGDVFQDLRQFWLDSVPWCSELSRGLEKIIIMYEEQADQVRHIPETAPGTGRSGGQG